MIIRPATYSDLPVLLELGEKLYFFEKQYEPLLTFSMQEATQRYTRELENSFALFLMAEEAGKPVGYLYAHADRVEYLATNKRECEIEVIFVEETHRGQGVALELITQCLHWAQEKQVFRYKAGIFAKNTASQSVFKKLGFQPYHAVYTCSIKETESKILL